MDFASLYSYIIMMMMMMIIIIIIIIIMHTINQQTSSKIFLRILVIFLISVVSVSPRV